MIDNTKEWEEFVLRQPSTLFVQSIHYGEFYRMINECSWIIGIYSGNVLVGGSLIVSIHAKRGNFIYIPYGPILPEISMLEALRAWVDCTKALGIKNKYDFIRVSPFLKNTMEHQTWFSSMGFQNAPMHMLAETTWMLNIEKSEESLLKSMNKNHRNLVHRCESGGVRVEKTYDPSVFDKFHRLLDETGKRHKFHRFSRTYINNEFAAFARHGEMQVFLGYLPDGTLDAAAIISFFGTMACYRHGASLGANKKLPTSYAVQWKAIQEAQRRGCGWYNFWGVAPNGARPSHPFYGISHFKRGFGGEERNLLRCQDLPLTPKYWLNYSVETARRIWRGF